MMINSFVNFCKTLKKKRELHLNKRWKKKTYENEKMFWRKNFCIKKIQNINKNKQFEIFMLYNKYENIINVSIAQHLTFRLF